ncbi:MAG: excinuclease ABC subunit UvrC, partial [Quadrisphaera sp.]
GPGEQVPREVLVPVEPADPEQTAAWLSRLRGSRVDVRVPQRGDKRALLETVERNATGALNLHKTRRGGDLTSRSLALQELQEALGLDEAPLRIECYDVSHLQGSEVVASMVVFEDGLPRKSEYRKFNVRGDGPDGRTDDLASMNEVLTRRFRRHVDQQAADGELVEQVSGPVSGEVQPGIDPTTGRARRFAYAPQLVVVDGGQPQVEAAAAALADVGVTDVALCGLAKRLEEVWLPGEDHPVVLPRTSEGLYLLQRLRDEAHRFAISHHRSKRSKTMTTSALDGVPGLGPARKQALMARFGTLKALRAATPEQVAEVPGVGPATAAAVVAALAADAPAPAVDTATGELVE